jgi:anti-anti-sigma regulatory factor
MTEVSKFERDGLAFVVTRSKQSAVVAWEGVSDARDPRAFLDSVMQQVVKDLTDFEVTIDFRRLEYMNSATVAPLIKFIKTLDASSSSVLVVFSTADWQRTHYQCVKTIARTLKRVRVEVKPLRYTDAPKAT